MAAQVAEELKTVTYATPPVEEHRKKKTLFDVCDMLLTLAMLMPVRFSTTEGSFSMMDMISLVSLWAPTSPLPFDTMVIFLALHRGWEISEAIWTGNVYLKVQTVRLFIEGL